jgi:hypothetical protein
MAAAPVPRGDVCFPLEQQVVGFKIACLGTKMQWSLIPENKQVMSNVMTELRLITRATMMKTVRLGKITRTYLPLSPRCSAAADGRFQGGFQKRRDATVCADTCFAQLSHQH